jgi:hypothetical protein
MTRSVDDFVARWSYELIGLLMASAHELPRANDFAADGAAFRRQIRRGLDLLKRIHAEDVAVPLPANGEQKPSPNGQQNGTPPNLPKR